MHCEIEENEEFCEVSPVTLIRKLRNLHFKDSFGTVNAAATAAIKPDQCTDQKLTVKSQPLLTSQE